MVKLMSRPPLSWKVTRERARREKMGPLPMTPNPPFPRLLLLVELLLDLTSTVETALDLARPSGTNDPPMSIGMEESRIAGSNSAAITPPERAFLKASRNCGSLPVMVAMIPSASVFFSWSQRPKKRSFFFLLVVQ
jgi:hypothetical protein